jgi:hypothetical protein
VPEKSPILWSTTSDREECREERDHIVCTWNIFWAVLSLKSENRGLYSPAALCHDNSNNLQTSSYYSENKSATHTATVVTTSAPSARTAELKTPHTCPTVVGTSHTSSTVRVGLIFSLKFFIKRSTVIGVTLGTIKLRNFCLPICNLQPKRSDTQSDNFKCFVGVEISVSP